MRVFLLTFLNVSKMIFISAKIKQRVEMKNDEQQNFQMYNEMVATIFGNSFDTIYPTLFIVFNGAFYR